MHAVSLLYITLEFQTGIYRESLDNMSDYMLLDKLSNVFFEKNLSVVDFPMLNLMGVWFVYNNMCSMQHGPLF